MSSAPLTPLLAGLSAVLIVAGAHGLTRRPRPRRATATGAASSRRGLAERHWLGRHLAARLARAASPVGADAFLGLVLGAAVIAAAATLALTGQPLLVPGAVAGVLGAAAALLASADRRHAVRVAGQLPGVAQHLASAVGAGLSLRQALGRAAADAPEPAATELRRVAAELALGARVEVALDGLTARVPAHDLRVMVTAILVQRRTGGNMARALAGLASRLEERTRLTRELRGATAQARMTAGMVALLPAVGGLAVEIAAPGTLARALGAGVGLVLLGVAGALYAVGLLWIQRISRVEA